jgi:hypothetical protein
MKVYTEEKVHYVLYNDNELNTYRRNRTASPETSFFLLTNALHPVVKRCLRGWPVTSRPIRNYGFSKSNSIHPILFIQSLASVSVFASYVSVDFPDHLD